MIGENENIEIWEKNLFNSIKDVSDIDFQKSTWLGLDPNYISSFTEVISTLYDDFDFERYILYYKSFKGEDKLYKVLSELNEMINKYKKQGYEIESKPKGQELILVDPQWIEITFKAKEVFQTASTHSKLSGI
ncbi:hypothetical protein [Pontibacter pudoricolor]|uniref:hypothetical protein n=1 Tax=Pontibacter pudoricolor TaxID=2694930 RepID=UPI001390906A|nr:hypothetical protein [Pontibacter pudoricolor]